MQPLGWSRRRFFALIVLAISIAVSLPGCTHVLSRAPASQPVNPLARPDITYWLTTRQQPRPLRIHNLRIDLKARDIELATVLAADPDGSGPATAELTNPLALARKSSALILVNCNPWQAIPDAQGKQNTNWYEGQPVQIMGLAAEHAIVRSAPADPKYCSVWIDGRNQCHIGHPNDPAQVHDGGAGFLQLVHERNLMQQPSAGGGLIHPRTALGLDASGRYLYLVVVDGRQPGYSEGMSYYELAVYMRELGCRNAVNLDGGGSSIMLASTGGGNYRILNDPSTKRDGVSVPRPVPIALVVRNRPQQPRALPQSSR